MGREIHNTRWTPDLITRFWKNYESTPGMELWHFARQRGNALLRYVQDRTALSEPVLDLGCGSGYLIDILVRRGLACFGADLNPKAIDLLNNRLSGEKSFLGARPMESGQKIPYKDRSAGTLFLLETIEHLLPEFTGPLFSEINRVLKPGGVAVITAPYREDLASSLIVCPSCRAVFHKTQHMRSFDKPGVTDIIRNAGLTPLSCSATLLLPDMNVWIKAQKTPARVSVACPECGTACSSPNGSIFRRWKSLISELRHLVCIANK